MAVVRLKIVKNRRQRAHLAVKRIAAAFLQYIRLFLKQLRKPFHGIHAGKAFDWFGDFLVFRSKQMPEALVLGGHKRL